VGLQRIAASGFKTAGGNSGPKATGTELILKGYINFETQMN
jgi:hypothetical protein